MEKYRKPKSYCKNKKLCCPVCTNINNKYAILRCLECGIILRCINDKFPQCHAIPIHYADETLYECIKCNTGNYDFYDNYSDPDSEYD